MGEIFALLLLLAAFLICILTWKKRRDARFNEAHKKLLRRFEEVTGRSSAQAVAENIAKKYQMSSDEYEREAGYIIEQALADLEANNLAGGKTDD